MRRTSPSSAPITRSTVSQFCHPEVLSMIMINMMIDKHDDGDADADEEDTNENLSGLEP